MDTDTLTVVTLLFAEQLQMRALMQRPTDPLSPIEAMVEYTEGFIRSLRLSGVHQPRLEAQLRAVLRQVQAAWTAGELPQHLDGGSR